VKWVQKNIASFGGDPTKITLFGQSAGAVAVDAYNLAYPDDPIVTGLIMNSGTALLQTFSQDMTHSNFSFVARGVGCSAEKELECMRAVKWEKIEAFLKAYQDGAKAPPISFVPVKDDVTFFKDPAGRAKEGKLSKKVSFTNSNKPLLDISKLYKGNRCASNQGTLFSDYHYGQHTKNYPF
jgi:acetylcholinesterase